MAPPRGKWGLDAVVECLLDIARRPLGLDDAAFLRTQRELLAWEPVRTRTDRGASPAEAIEAVIEDVRLFGGQAGVVETDLEAVSVLLAASSRSRRALDRTERLERACAELNKDLPAGKKLDPYGLYHGRRRDKKRQGPLRSPESQLYERFVQAAKHVSAHASSSTQGLTRTPEVGSRTCHEMAYLLGTWRGTTTSAWLLKDPDEEGVGVAACFMTIEVSAEELLVRWLYRRGPSTAISTRLVHTGEGHRLVCCYEADLTFTPETVAPSHRGSCLLDIGVGEIEGPYFTDRRTHGILRFAERVAGIATDFESAERLFRQQR